MTPRLWDLAQPQRRKSRPGHQGSLVLYTRFMAYSGEIIAPSENLLSTLGEGPLHVGSQCLEAKPLAWGFFGLPSCVRTSGEASGVERPDRTEPPSAWPLRVSTDMSTEGASSAVQEVVRLLIPILQVRAPRHGPSGAWLVS